MRKEKIQQAMDVPARSPDSDSRANSRLESPKKMVNLKLEARHIVTARACRSSAKGADGSWVGRICDACHYASASGSGA